MLSVPNRLRERYCSEYELITPDEFNRVLEVLKSGQSSELEVLCQNYVNFPRGKDPLVGELWFILAVGTASVSTIRWMLKKGVDINLKSATNEASIHVCIDRKSSDRYEILRDLIAAGADIEIRGRNDWTPLHWAAARNDAQATKMLLEAGANINARTRIDMEATPEEEAAALGAVEAVKTIKEWRLEHGRSALE